MKTNSTPTPTYKRPLLDFTTALGRHQRDADHKQAVEILDVIANSLKSIQHAYELMPANAAGKWFLRTSYESAQRSIRERCACLKAEIGRVRPSLPLGPRHPKSKAMSKTLDELCDLLNQATNDLSHLSTFEVFIEPDEPSPPSLPLDDLIASLEA